ncbi:efflux RND transporter permease subunit [Candidatus Uabimicrobium sp. HlEnr_7]|uniref:efflux RND transporter permease subunit n=1 Tax=Candidatus Uabimicrobium helgolandensis TaxID=3095367 RepID=UPI00355743B6
MNLTRFALEKRTIVIAFVITFMMWGIYVFQNISRREDPEFTIRSALISTSWPGATAEDIENLITDVIEEEIETVDEIEEIESTSYVGLSIIKIDLYEEDLPYQEINNVWDKVQKKINDIKGNLPSNAQDPYLNRDFGDTSAMLLAIYEKPKVKPVYSPRDLEKITDRLKNRLRQLSSVGKISKHGVENEAIYIETDIGQWSQLKITLEELRNILQSYNIVASGGNIDTSLNRFSIKPSGEITDIKEFEHIVVSQEETGNSVLLKDLNLKVSRRYSEPYQVKVRYSDSETSAPSIVLSLVMKKGKNIVALGNEVRKTIEEAKLNLLPSDIEIAVLSDIPKQVKQSIDDFVVSLIQAIVLVIAVALLLIGLRVAIVMATAIPIVMISSIGLMYLFDVDLNIMSIAALIIALGMLVDNAIEVCDNVHHFINKGYEKRRAVIEGVGQIAFPIFIATLTTVCAFLPMLTLPGGSGQYVRSIPIVVCISLLFSYTLAVTFTSIMAYCFMKAGTTTSPVGYLWKCISYVPKKLRKKTSSKPSKSIFELLCGAAIRFKFLTIMLALVFMIYSFSLLATGKIANQFFPEALRNQFTIVIDLPNGSPIKETNDITAQLEKIIQLQSKQRLQNMVSFVGKGGPRFFLSINPENPRENTATIIINTVSPFVVDSYIKDIESAIYNGIPQQNISSIAGARIKLVKLLKGPPVPYPVEVKINGSNIHKLHLYASKVEQILRDTPGTKLVHNSLGNMSYQLGVDVDEDRANLAGVSNASIAQTLNAFFSGYYLTTYREDDHKVPVYLRLPTEQRGNLELINQVYVEGNFGKVPLDELANIQPKWQRAKIVRRNQTREIGIRCQVQQGVLPDHIVRKILPKLKQLQEELPKEYKLEIAGEYKESKKSGGNMSRAFTISLVLIILCLIIQYNSFIKTWIVLATIPLAFAGSFFGLYLSNNPLGFMTMLGLLSLAGIVINVAIVLIEFIEHRIQFALESKEGLATKDDNYVGLTKESFRRCVIEGTKQRIVPIMLTTLTTVGGLIPLVLSGDPLFAPMAVTIMSGLIFSTVLALFITPAIYCFFVENLRVKTVKQ